MVDWNAIGTVVGMLATGAGGAIIAHFRTKKVEVPTLGTDVNTQAPPTLPQRRYTDHIPDKAPCKQCDLDKDMDEFREEVKEGFDAVNLRLQSLDTSNRVQETKLANVDNNVNELFGLVRQLAADVNKTIGKVEVIQTRN